MISVICGTGVSSPYYSPHRKRRRHAKPEEEEEASVATATNGPPKATRGSGCDVWRKRLLPRAVSGVLPFGAPAGGRRPTPGWPAPAPARRLHPAQKLAPPYPEAAYRNPQSIRSQPASSPQPACYEPEAGREVAAEALPTPATPARQPSLWYTDFV